MIPDTWPWARQTPCCYLLSCPMPHLLFLNPCRFLYCTGSCRLCVSHIHPDAAYVNESFVRVLFPKRALVKQIAVLGPYLVSLEDPLSTCQSSLVSYQPANAHLALRTVHVVHKGSKLG